MATEAKESAKRVLVIDDSPLIRKFHSNILTQIGLLVTTASDGSEGLELFFQRPFDLVLTDINMQGIDGYEVVRRIREDANFDGIPIIIVSTESDENARKRGMLLGANFYLTKPIESERAIDCIHMLLGGR